MYMYMYVDIHVSIYIYTCMYIFNVCMCASSSSSPSASHPSSLYFQISHIVSVMHWAGCPLMWLRPFIWTEHGLEWHTIPANTLWMHCLKTMNPTTAIIRLLTFSSESLARRRFLACRLQPVLHQLLQHQLLLQRSPPALHHMLHHIPPRLPYPSAADRQCRSPRKHRLCFILQLPGQHLKCRPCSLAPSRCQPLLSDRSRPRRPHPQSRRHQSCRHHRRPQRWAAIQVASGVLEATKTGAPALHHMLHHIPPRLPYPSAADR